MITEGPVVGFFNAKSYLNVSRSAFVRSLTTNQKIPGPIRTAIAGVANAVDGPFGSWVMDGTQLGGGAILELLQWLGNLLAPLDRPTRALVVRAVLNYEPSALALFDHLWTSYHNYAVIRLIGNSRTGAEVNQSAIAFKPTSVAQYCQTWQHPVQVGGT